MKQYEIYNLEYTVTQNSNAYLLLTTDVLAYNTSTIYTIYNVVISSMTVESQNYDDKGRITNNNQIGEYLYNDSNHPYQFTQLKIYCPQPTIILQQTTI